MYSCIGWKAVKALNWSDLGSRRICLRHLDLSIVPKRHECGQTSAGMGCLGLVSRATRHRPCTRHRQENTAKNRCSPVQYVLEGKHFPACVYPGFFSFSLGFSDTSERGAMTRACGSLGPLQHQYHHPPPPQQQQQQSTTSSPDPTSTTTVPAPTLQCYCNVRDIPVHLRTAARGPSVPGGSRVAGDDRTASCRLAIAVTLACRGRSLVRAIGGPTTNRARSRKLSVGDGGTGLVLVVDSVAPSTMQPSGEAPLTAPASFACTVCSSPCSSTRRIHAYAMPCDVAWRRMARASLIAVECDIVSQSGQGEVVR
nr:hypothetical protein CFP56_21721 [Quercus suber]